MVSDQDATPKETLILHASAVALDGRALLFSGPSGTGKSLLSLDMMAYGCTLVADDTVILTREGERLLATAAEATRGRIEARGLGLLWSDTTSQPSQVIAEVDLSREDPDRLPHAREIDRLGVRLPLLLKPQGPNPAASLLQFLKSGRSDP